MSNHTFNYNGLPVHYKKMGSGKPLVFLHGWGVNSGAMLPLARRLSKTHTCYLIDLPGFGKSESPPESGWRVEDYALSVWYLVQKLQPSPRYIVAHSFGCRVATVFAALFPQAVDKMIFFAPAGIRTFSLKRALRVGSYKLRKLFCCSNPDKRYGSQDYRNCPSTLKNTFVKVVNQDLSIYAKRIVCDVLIVNGTEDVQTPLKHARKMNKLIRHSNLVQTDGDHFALFYTPSAFAEVVRLFLEGGK